MLSCAAEKKSHGAGRMYASTHIPKTVYTFAFRFICNGRRTTEPRTSIRKYTPSSKVSGQYGSQTHAEQVRTFEPRWPGSPRPVQRTKRTENDHGLCDMGLGV